MTSHPILFSGAMVRAILDGRKTQTRRAVKPQPFDVVSSVDATKACWSERESPCYQPLACPYGVPGDQLWVRETFRLWNYSLTQICVEFAAGGDDKIYNLPMGVEKPAYLHRSRGDDLRKRLRPSIHMPRWASRITLAVVAVRVERLQDITEEDAIAEGIDTSVTNPSPTGIPDFYAKRYVHANECFADLWRLRNGPDSWDANPYVWVITFKTI